MKKIFIDENMALVNGCTFILGKSKKFDKDFEKVITILEKDTLSKADRLQLVSMYTSAYHESGKIAGCTSFDSSATNCGFCKGMRKKAENNPAHICNYCYDHSAEKYKINSLNRHSLNMLIMQTIDFMDDELSIIPIGIINRIDSAGDIPNIIYARNMIKISKINKNVRFAFWTKNARALIAATNELGKPENAIYIRSSEIIGRPADLPEYFDYVFTVYPNEESITAALNAGAAECNGKKCRECGYKCYFGKHKSSTIAELLRGVNGTKRTEIIKWLEKN